MPNRHATLTSLFEDVADAIRSKTGDSAEIKADDFDTAIEAISTGGGLPDEAFKQLVGTTDNPTSYALGGGAGEILAKYFAPQINRLMFPVQLNDARSLFAYNTSEDLSNINVRMGLQYTTGSVNFEKMFENCKKLKKLPKLTLNGVSFSTISSTNMFYNCYDLRYIDDDFLTIDETKMQLQQNNTSNMFNCCFSLRKVPNIFYTIAKLNNSYFGSSYYYNTFYNCYTLDEALDIPVSRGVINASIQNILGSAFFNCYRLKRLTFETNEDGSPKTLNITGNFTFDLTSVGTSATDSSITSHNTGISITKKVSNQESYDLLKNDPDWYTTKVEYCRYNHDSAVETINSLPYLTGGGVGTLKLKGAAGSATDGGAVNTLTNAEIAVATAKGWTVTLA